MAWVEVALVEDTFDEAKDGSASATRIYYAESDTPVANDAALSASHGDVAVPDAATAYSESRPRCVVTSRKVKRVNRNSPFQFLITVTNEDPTDGSLDTTGLLNKPARISTSDEHAEEPYYTDAEDNPVRNTAGEPYSTYPTRDSGVTVYTIKKYVNATTKAAIRAARKTNNAGAVTIDGTSHDEDTLLLFEAGFEPVDGATGVYDATIIIKHNPDGWIDEIPNVGFSQLVDGKRKDITQIDADDNDVPVSRPWPLNSDGSKKAWPDADIDLLVFYPYEQSAWTGVPLS